MLKSGLKAPGKIVQNRPIQSRNPVFLVTACKKARFEARFGPARPGTRQASSGIARIGLAPSSPPGYQRAAFSAKGFPLRFSKA